MSINYSNSLKKLKGTGVAIVTPFEKNGDVDYVALTKLIEHLLRGKVEYLVVLGTTGESVTLSKEEKTKIVGHVKKVVRKRVPIVIGIGGNNTLEVIETIKHTDFAGIEAILSVSPYYNKPTQQGIYEHYKAIAQSTLMPIILYNVPGRTGSNIAAETTLRLANDFKNIIGIKEASANLEQQHMKIIRDKPTNFLVISGDDALTLPVIACGGDGVISVVANAYPKDFSDMVRLSLKGDFVKARKLHYKLTEFIDLLFADGSPGGIKEALVRLGIGKNYLRLPLQSPNNAVIAKIDKFVKNYK
ncbi:MAG: 4-hydroxy-tetrahydrodipicolinate synthase [Bacteroidetes bacterium]|nr:4-hydroxy-tetrahydrodipicolinate synthase [Bacteroidota bacterium]